MVLGDVAELEPGDRIRLVSMPHDPDPVGVGRLGTVVNVVQPVTGRWQVWVDWDDGRKLAMCIPPDEFERISKGTEEEGSSHRT
jgi:hypothetical protein